MSVVEYLGVKGNHSVANPDAWHGKEDTSTDGTNVGHLNAEHFIIHTLLHCSRHLSDGGFAEIKWLIDLLYAFKTWRVDWLKLMKIAEKWGIEKDVLPVIATLNQYWQTRIPLPITSKPIALNVLVQGAEDRQKEYYAKLPASYLERLMRLRKLPDKASQVRYALHLFFPSPENPAGAMTSIQNGV